MNLRFGDQASDIYPNDSVQAEKLRKKLALMNKFMHVSDVVVDVMQQAPPSATPEQMNDAVQKILAREREASVTKPPYLMYAALAAGAYLMFK